MSGKLFTEHDELLELKAHFFLGNYQMAVSEGANVTSADPAVLRERDLFILRAHLCLGQYDIVLSEIPESTNDGDQIGVRHLARYLCADTDRDAIIAQSVRAVAAHPSSPVLALAVASMYTYEGDYSEALRYCHSKLSLEIMAMQVDLYLRLNRVDLAERTVRAMHEADDDATLTQVANAWLNLELGGKKAEEAFYIFQEMCDKYEETPLLLNGIAVAHMHQLRFEEADAALMKALSKRAADPETLINLIVCAQHLKKAPELITRYLAQLKSTAPNHPYVRRFVALENQFDELEAKNSEVVPVATD